MIEKVPRKTYSRLRLSTKVGEAMGRNLYIIMLDDDFENHCC